MKISGIFMGDTKYFNVCKALESLNSKHKGFFTNKIMDLNNIDNNPNAFKELMDRVEASDLILIYFHGSVAHLNSFNKYLEAIRGKKILAITSIPEEIQELMDYSSMDIALIHKSMEYFQADGIENMENMFLNLYNNLIKDLFEVEDIKTSVDEGLYTSKGIINKEDEMDYMKSLANKDVVAIITNVSYIKNHNRRHIDYLMESIENLGLEVFCLFSSLAYKNEESLGLKKAMDKYFYVGEEVLPKAIISLTGFSLTAQSNIDEDLRILDRGQYSIFSKLDIPVVQGITIYNSFEEYEKNINGMDIASISLSVYQPEMDGQIISIPIATSEYIKDSGIERRVFIPMENRCDKLALMIKNWIDLRSKKNQKKKIAIVLHNMPPRNDTIGSAYGLDTINSIYNVLRWLKEEGFYLEHEYESGKEIIEEILASVTNDNRWISNEKTLEKAVDLVSEEKYEIWFKGWKQSVKSDLIKNWGKPPGETMNVNGDIIIPGKINGNVFLGLQPNRGSVEKADANYHSTENPAPHHYQAYYRWIEEDFKADIILHVGTHGTLEWLPGKEVGLYESCYPDINIGSIPHIYIYNLEILGEGMQARRRSNAVILSHLTPSMDRSDTYGDLVEVEELLEAYGHAKITSKGQLDPIINKIYEASDKYNLLKDLNLSKEDFYKDKKRSIDLIHNWINQIKNSLVKDGLHIYGKIPEGRRKGNLIWTLVRNKQGNIKSLVDSILIAMGEEPKAIRKAINENSAGNWIEYEKYNKATEYSLKIMKKISDNDYDYKKSIKEICKYKFNDGKTNDLKHSIDFICNIVNDKIERTHDEEVYFKKAINGEFVKPSLGGSPSRGNIDLLPTGKNFYSIDPEKVPSNGAWEVGKDLGNSLLEKQLEKTGEYPKSIGIIVYSSNTMKTYGEDIGEILYLMGARPVYLGNTDRVIGIEAIPMEELNRPRIDVTLRISGLFRDTFPNIIKLIDDAVILISTLDESYEENYIKKHIEEEIESMVEEGIDESEARDRSSVRVFGCPPGTYGAGINNLIESKKWSTSNDLGNSYVDWSSHGYSKAYHGKIMRKEFLSKLSKVDLTVKNEPTEDIDILESDDFYTYHGGLIAAIATVKDEPVNSYVGKSSDLDFIKTDDLDREVSRIMRSRILNPKWVKGLMEHGYKGALDLSKNIDIVFGWDSTTSIIEDWMYDEITENFIENKEVKEWIEEENYNALYNITERLLEANKRGQWKASKDKLASLQKIYMNMEGRLEDGY